jgi:hypothetical protein
MNDSLWTNLHEKSNLKKEKKNLWFTLSDRACVFSGCALLYSVGLTELCCHSLVLVKSLRLQYVLIQAASPLLMPLMVSHLFLPVIQAPSVRRPNIGKFTG